MVMDRDPSRTTEQQENTYVVDDGASEVQRGIFTKPTFFGDSSKGSAAANFSAAADFASSLSSIVGTLRSNTVSTRNQGDAFRLTNAEMAELVKRAKSISTYGNIPQDVVEDFLIILCYIDNIEDLTTIADGVQLAALADPAIIRKPFVILSIQGLETIAYLASAVEGLVHMFRRYLRMAQNTDNSKGESMGNILSALGGIVSGLGGATARLQNGSAEDALGNFMSELITGKRIPMTVIAKNPNLQSPSYAGKVFFGEAPSALTNIDITQLFNKKIAVFPKPSNGAGTTSFGIQNFSGFTNSMSITGIAAKLLTGSSAVTEGTKKARQIATVVDKISTLTGATAGEIVDIRRADTAIPIMQAMSAVVSGTDKSVFSTDTFAQAWLLSNSVSNKLQTIDPMFAETVKRFL